MSDTKYPRQVILKDERLKKLLKEKNEMVLDGREKSIEVEEIEKEMAEIESEMVIIEKSVEAKDLEEKAKEVTEEMNKIMEKMQAVQKELYERATSMVPKELKDRYDLKKKEKEQKENERNKIALKVQKWKDKIIPLTQKIAKPQLTEEFEDYNEIRLENGEIVLEIFSHLEDFKARKRQVANR